MDESLQPRWRVADNPVTVRQVDDLRGLVTHLTCDA
jgi:hypothetical protein